VRVGENELSSDIGTVTLRQVSGCAAARAITRHT